jgi:16S rRNA (cytidine1402-2'-O)-methyltransferase
VETALVASGLADERYQFVGYVPRRDGERAAFVRELALYPHTVVAFESPRRLPATLRLLADEMPERAAAICRELTKRFEQIERGSVAELANRFPEPPRGEVTIVVGAADTAVADVTEEATAAVAELVQAGVPRRRAVDLVSRLTGAPKNALYKASL